MKTKDMILTAFFAALIAVGAYIKIPAPICPITLQFPITMLAGLLLGGKRGAAATGLYVLIGLMGFPVFTGGGGISYVLQPTFGYFPAFMLGSYTAGVIAHKNPSDIKRLLAACFADLAISYVIGIFYYWLAGVLWLENPSAIGKILLCCGLMPLPKDIILCVVTAFLAKRLLPIIKMNQPQTA